MRPRSIIYKVSSLSELTDWTFWARLQYGYFEPEGIWLRGNVAKDRLIYK